jgi:ribosomal protein S18 acetylase RimI-like enzyme
MFVIHQATVSDYDAIATIGQPVHRDHAVHAPERFQSHAEPVPRSRLTDLLDSPVGTVLVAEDDGMVVGFVIGRLVDAAPLPVLRPRRSVMVDIVAVAITARGRGIGHALMEAVSAWGAGQGATEVELSVFEWNTDAISFYERLGMTTSQRRMRKPL